MIGGKVQFLRFTVFCPAWWLMWLLLSGSLAAQGTQTTDFRREIGLPEIKFYHPRDYQQHSQNWAVIQDDRGVLYFANGQGLLEYDGVNWRLIETSKKVRIRSLAKDTQGTIYVGASGDFGYLKPDSIGQLQFVSLLDSITADSLRISEVWKTFATGQGVFFQTFDAVFHWNRNQLRTLVPKEPLGLSVVIRDSFYVPYRDGTVLTVVDDSLQIAGRNWPLRTYGALPFDARRTLLYTAHGLFLNNGGAVTKFASEANAFFKENFISSGVRLANGDMAFATYRGGVVTIDSSGKILKILDKTTGLANNDIKSLYVDAQNHLWLAMQFGLSQVKLTSPYTYFAETTEFSGLTNAIVRHDGQVFAATSQGLYRLQLGPGTSAEFQKVAGIPYEAFAFVSTENGLLVGTNGGVYLMTNSREFRRISDNLPVFRLLRSKQDPHVIYAALRSGLGLIGYRRGQWRFEKRLDGINEPILSVVEAQDETIWLCTNQNGVLRVKIDENIRNGVQISRFGERLVFPSSNIVNVNGRILFSTRSGLRYFDEQTQRLALDSTFGTALADSTRMIARIFQIDSTDLMIYTAKDEAHQYWRAKLSGENTWQIDRHYFGPLRRFGGVYCIYGEPNGINWFGCNTGIVRFDKGVAQAAAGISPPVIRQVSNVTGDKVFYGGSGQYPALSRTIDYKDNSLQFQFALPDFAATAENRYQYQLQGFDSDWSSWTAEGKRDYTNLPEGDYQFRVRARGASGQMIKGKPFRFRVLAPWYRSVWAYVCYALLASGLLALVVKIRVRLLEKKTAQLESIISERTDTIRQQAQKLAELDKTKSRFFTNISHEFRTPMTLILGPLERRIAKAVDSADRRELGMMHRNASRVLELINQLLDLSKLESGALSLRLSTGDFPVFVRGFVMSFASLAEDKDIDFNFVHQRLEKSSQTAANVRFDRGKIEKILNNLLSNAFKFTPPAGKITVKCAEAGDLALDREQGFKFRQYEIQVINSGSTIAAEHLPHLFDRFYQADARSLRQGEGSGIGLALTRELVALHDGKIAVESADNKTTFIITITLQVDDTANGHDTASQTEARAALTGVAAFMESDRQSTDRAIPASESAEKKIVLIVDDHPEVREYIRSCLIDEFSLIEAENGRSGITTASEIIPDLIISDVMMPEMDGVQLAAALQADERTSHIPIILLTAKAAIDDKLTGLQTGADAYLTKPFNEKELQIRVRNLIDQRRKLRERFWREHILQAQEIQIESIEDALLRRLMSILEANIGNEDFSVGELASGVNMSVRQLHRKVTSITGKTPVELIRLIRLKRAKQLLEKNAGSVSEIAFEVGFSSLSYFSKMFRQEFGKLPSDV